MNKRQRGQEGKKTRISRSSLATFRVEEVGGLGWLCTSSLADWETKRLIPLRCKSNLMLHAPWRSVTGSGIEWDGTGELAMFTQIPPLPRCYRSPGVRRGEAGWWRRGPWQLTNQWGVDDGSRSGQSRNEEAGNGLLDWAGSALSQMFCLHCCLFQPAERSWKLSGPQGNPLRVMKWDPHLFTNLLLKMDRFNSFFFWKESEFFHLCIPLKTKCFSIVLTNDEWIKCGSMWEKYWF